jgi:hypothetical protein
MVLRQGKNASDRVDKLIRETADWRSEVMVKIRKIILSADVGIVEEWKWMGTPTFSKNSVICIMNPHKGKVKVTFAHGAALKDPEKVFNAGFAGKQWRALDVFEGDKINERALKALVKEGVAYDAMIAKKPAPKATSKARKSK